MTTEMFDFFLSAGLALGTIGGCALAIYLLPWTDAELDATERLARQVADRVSPVRGASGARLVEVSTS